MATISVVYKYSPRQHEKQVFARFSVDIYAKKEHKRKKNPGSERIPDLSCAACAAESLSDYSAAGVSTSAAGASTAFFELRRVVFLAAFLVEEARAASLKSTSSMRAMSAPSP